MKKRLIPVSPPHLLDTIVIASVLLISLLAIVIANVVFKDWLFWPFYLSWGVFAICLSVAFAISYRGVIVTRIDELKASSFFINAKCYEINFQDVKYISFVTSANYGLDTNAVYIVLSNEKIKGKNLALSFSPKKQIVIRLSSKNYLWVRNILQALSIQKYMPEHFKDFLQIVRRNHIHLKNVDGEIIYILR